LRARGQTRSNRFEKTKIERADVGRLNSLMCKKRGGRGSSPAKRVRLNIEYDCTIFSSRKIIFNEEYRSISAMKRSPLKTRDRRKSCWGKEAADLWRKETADKMGKRRGPTSGRGGKVT